MEKSGDFTDICDAKDEKNLCRTAVLYKNLDRIYSCLIFTSF